MSLQMISDDVAVDLSKITSMRRLPGGNAVIMVDGDNFVTDPSISFDYLIKIINEPDPSQEPATVVRTVSEFAG